MPEYYFHGYYSFSFLHISQNDAMNVWFYAPGITFRPQIVANMLLFFIDYRTFSEW